MIIKVNNKNVENAKMESERLYELLMLVKQARKDVEAEKGALHLKRVDMYVDFQKEKCDATYSDDDAILSMTHKISSLSSFAEEVAAIFRIMAGREQKITESLKKNYDLR